LAISAVLAVPAVFAVFAVLAVLGIRAIHQLALPQLQTPQQQAQAPKLDKAIAKNLKELGYGG